MTSLPFLRNSFGKGRFVLTAALAAMAAWHAVLPSSLMAQSAPTRVEITQGVIEPMPIAVPPFLSANESARQLAQSITQVVIDDLSGSGLFREIPRAAHIGQITDFNAPIRFSDWRAINADALVTGQVSVQGNALSVSFHLFDVVAERGLGKGLRLDATGADWRRIAHKVADQIYSRLTGEAPYFDTKIAFIAEDGPKDNRRKRLAVMDYDGANLRYLTDGSQIVLAPRFAPSGNEIIYTSYEQGQPQLYLMSLATGVRRPLRAGDGLMSFAPRFSPDGRFVVYSLSNGANTDLYQMELDSGRTQRLTNTPAIETAPSYAPDGQRLVFESDRDGSQQIYTMRADGSGLQRISQGQGRYGTPVWSPRGDLIAFTKMYNGRFHIGVMQTDGSQERLLSASFLDEGPSWAPNGRVIIFFRETSGASGAPSLYTVDITGQNLRRVPTPGFASDPAWSRLLP